MNRIKGFQILEIPLNFQDLVDKKIINCLNRKTGKESFFLTNDNLFFKEADNFELYRELLGSKICKSLGVKHVDYDLMKIRLKDREYSGLICKDYRINDYQVLTISDLIKEYQEVYPEFVNYLMNLDYIWNILEYRYQDYPNKEKIVKNMMEDLVNYFFVDELIGNIDHDIFNCEIMENGRDAMCCPYFDFGLSFQYGTTRFVVDSKSGVEIPSNLKRFLDISDNSFIDKFISMYNYLTPNKLEDLFQEIEEDINYELPSNFKNITYLAYRKNYEELGRIVNKNKRR